jgi:hypothetical protein
VDSPLSEDIVMFRRLRQRLRFANTEGAEKSVPKGPQTVAPSLQPVLQSLRRRLGDQPIYSLTVNWHRDDSRKPLTLDELMLLIEEDFLKHSSYRKLVFNDDVSRFKDDLRDYMRTVIVKPITEEAILRISEDTYCFHIIGYNENGTNLYDKPPNWDVRDSQV